MTTLAPKADEVFWRALEIASPDERAKFLAEACGNDAALRAEAEGLLAAYPKIERFLERPAAAVGATVDQPHADRPGTQIGPYKLLQQIGEGGMGVVYMAEQMEPVERRVALKIIKPGMDSRQVIARFEAERQALAVMDHPNIAKVLDAGTTESGRPYFVMELVRGQPITQYCDEKHLTPRQRLELLLPVCQAIQHAHQKGIIHRDIKPTNILVAEYDQQPVPKVIDFGVAKAISQPLTEKTMFTGYGQIVGTLEYMSPEQARVNQLDIDTRSDIYSLGVLLYELLTGSTPFDPKRLRSAAFDEMLRIIREEEPPKPSTRLESSRHTPCAVEADSTRSVPTTLASIAAQRQTEPAKLTKLVRGELDWIVMRALEKDRNRRYETAAGLAMDVQRYLADEPVQACPPSAGYRLKKFARRNMAALTLVGMASAVLAVLGWALVDWGARRTAAHQVVTQALAEADDAQKKGQYPEALAAARRAESLAVNSMASRGLRERAQRRRADLELVLRLDEIRLEPAAAVKDDHFDVAIADQRYDAEFRAAGLAVDELTPEAAAERVRATTVAVELAAALDCWAGARRRTRGMEDAGWRHLLEVARRADPNEWRCRLRDALAARDRQALEDLAKAKDVAELPSASLGILGNTLNNLDAPSQAFELLRAAQRRYPDDFWINHHLGFALCHLKPAQFEEAIRFYTVAVALRPQSPGTRLNFGTALFKNGRLDEAVAAYREAIRLKPEYASAHAALGTALAEQGKLTEAETGCREAIRLQPDLYLAHRDLGAVLWGQKKLAEAEAAFKEAIRLKPDFALGHDNLGTALADQGKLAEAEAHCREAIRINPDSASAHNNLGTALVGQGKLAEAEFREAIRLKPDFPEAHYNLGNLLRGQSKLAEAEAHFREAIRVKPDYAPAHDGLGKLLKGQGKLAEAETEFREAIRLKPEFAEAHVHLGLALRGQKKLDEAIAAYRKASELDPKLANAHANLGDALLHQKQVDEAIAAYRKVIELGQDHAETHNNLGVALAQQKNWPEAIACYEKAIALSPTFAVAYGGLGDALHAQGRLADAVDAYRKAIAHNPNYAGAHHNLARALVDQEKLDEAIPYYRKAIALDPNFTLARNNLGLALFRKGLFDEAIAEFGKAVRVEPDSAGAWCYRGDAYAELKQFDKAIADFSKAIELKHDFAEAWNSRGLAYKELQQCDKSIEDLSKAIELKHDFAEAWNNRGLAYGILKQYDKAIADLSKSIELKRDYATAWHNRALAQYYLTRYDKAVADFSKAIELEPDHAGAWHNRGTAYSKWKQYDKAIADLSKAIELRPADADSWNNRGNVYYYRKQYDKAVADYSKATELKPDYAEAWHSRGKAHQDLTQYDKAIADYRKALELFPRHATRCNELAWLLTTCPEERLRDPKQAVELGKRAVELAPKDGNHWNTLGAAQYRAGDSKAAIEALNKSMELRKEGDSFGWFFLAMAHWRLDKKEEARQWYDRAAAWAEQHRPYHDELLLFQAEAAGLLGVAPPTRKSLSPARAHARSAQWQQAADRYAEAEAVPEAEGGGVGFEHACLLLLVGDRAGYRRVCAAMLDAQQPKPRGFLVARACTLAPDAVEGLEPAEKAAAAELAGNTTYWALTASAGLHYRAGRFQQADEMLRQCLKDNPGWDGKVLDWLWLSLACHRLGREDEARQWLDKARAWLDNCGGKMPEQVEGEIGLHLHDWLEAQILRREAEALIGDSGWGTPGLPAGELRPTR